MIIITSLVLPLNSMDLSDTSELNMTKVYFNISFAFLNFVAFQETSVSGVSQGLKVPQLWTL